MSRKGKVPIAVPKGVEVHKTNNELSVKGPKGSLKLPLVNNITIQVDPELITVLAKDATKDSKRFHGLYRALVQNMITGTTKGFEKRLEMIGVGYRANVQGHLLDLQLGFSHPTKLTIPQGIHVHVEKNTLIIVTGVDKQQVGEFAAQIRSIRPPEPYQGKGVRYLGEYVRRKAGKAAKK